MKFIRIIRADIANVQGDADRQPHCHGLQMDVETHTLAKALLGEQFQWNMQIARLYSST